MAKKSAKAAVMVVEAIRSLRSHKGFTPREILNYIAANYSINRKTARCVLTALKRGEEYGLLRADRGRYALKVAATRPVLSLERDGGPCKPRNSSPKRSRKWRPNKMHKKRRPNKMHKKRSESSPKRRPKRSVLTWNTSRTRRRKRPRKTRAVGKIPLKRTPRLRSKPRKGCLPAPGGEGKKRRKSSPRPKRTKAIGKIALKRSPRKTRGARRCRSSGSTSRGSSRSRSRGSSGSRPGGSSRSRSRGSSGSRPGGSSRSRSRGSSGSRPGGSSGSRPGGSSGSKPGGSSGSKPGGSSGSRPGGSSSSGSPSKTRSIKGGRRKPPNKYKKPKTTRPSKTSPGKKCGW